MDQTLKALSELTGAPPWPDRWLSLPEFAAELHRAGFWGRAGMGSLTEQGKQDFLAHALRAVDEEGLPVWADLGGRYKHDALLTPDDFCALLRAHDAAGGAGGGEPTGAHAGGRGEALAPRLAAPELPRGPGLPRV